jgi:DMSO reductase family type II enzyme heme b subunit
VKKMKVNRSDRPKAECLDASSAVWSDADTETVSLAAIPLDQQPTRYIRAAWSDRPYGSVTSVTASACASDEALFVRLEWSDDASPNGEFADAAAVVTGAGPVETLGSEAAETGLWYWAADRESAERFASRGPGVFSRSDASGVEAAAALGGGVWRVVLSGPLAEVVDDRIGIAVWNGSNEERAGLGAVSSWIALEKE